MDKKVRVAVSGAFDPIHAGHIDYIEAAKKLGTDLIVILNTDEFLRNKKGVAFMPYAQRLKIVSALRCVDAVYQCIDEDQTVAKTLRSIKPDIFAKGGDRDLDNIPQEERDACNEIGCKIVTGVGGTKTTSSSSLLKRYKTFD